MSKIRIHQDSGDLYVNVISVNSRYVDFIIHNDLSIDMKVPVGMSREMIERYVRLNETIIFQEYEKKKVRNHQMLPITLDLEEGRMIIYDFEKNDNQKIKGTVLLALFDSGENFIDAKTYFLTNEKKQRFEWVYTEPYCYAEVTVLAYKE